MLDSSTCCRQPSCEHFFTLVVARSHQVERSKVDASICSAQWYIAPDEPAILRVPGANRTWAAPMGWSPNHMCNSNVLGNGESGGLVVVWSPRHRLRRIARRVQVAGAADAASNLKNTMRTPALPHLMFERSKEGWTPCRPCMTCPVDRFRSCVLRATAAWDGTAQWMWRRRFR